MMKSGEPPTAIALLHSNDSRALQVIASLFSFQQEGSCVKRVQGAQELAQQVGILTRLLQEAVGSTRKERFF